MGPDHHCAAADPARLCHDTISNGGRVESCPDLRDQSSEQEWNSPPSPPETAVAAPPSATAGRRRKKPRTCLLSPRTPAASPPIQWCHSRPPHRASSRG